MKTLFKIRCLRLPVITFVTLSVFICGRASSVELLIADHRNSLRLLETTTGDSVVLAQAPGKIRLLTHNFDSGNYLFYDADSQTPYSFDPRSKVVKKATDEAEYTKSVAELPQIVASAIVTDHFLTVRRTGLSGLRLFDARLAGTGGLGEVSIRGGGGTAEENPFGLSCDIVLAQPQGEVWSLCISVGRRTQLWRCTTDTENRVMTSKLVSDLGEQGVADQVVVATDGSIWLGKTGTSTIFKLSKDKKTSEVVVVMKQDVTLVDMASWTAVSVEPGRTNAGRVDIRGVYLLTPGGGVVAPPSGAPGRPRPIVSTPISPVRVRSR